MEILLAIVVVFAVIFVGALISIGNERQRMAIDNLREQVVLWAVQDLKIKSEHLALNVQVPDPLDWLNNIAARACGYDLNIRIIEASNEPQSLVCTSGDDTSTIVFTPFSPMDLRKIKSNEHSRLTQFANHNPLVSLPRKVKVYEISVLNGGILFDLEMPLAWKGLTGQKWYYPERLWMYWI